MELPYWENLSFHLFDKIRFATMMSIDQMRAMAITMHLNTIPDGMGAGYGKTNFLLFNGTIY